MAYILHIDTSGNESQIFVASNETILASRSNPIQKDHGSIINIHIQEVMDEAKITWTDLGAISVMNGPGSYTGLRISLAAAKGICYAHQLPLILINKLDYLYQCIPIENRKTENGILIKAREHEYFYASYDANGNYLIEPSLSTKELLQTQISANTLQLFAIDDTLLTDFEQLHMIEINNTALNQIIFSSYNARQFSDLFLSEPFYMKNVYINKINKL